MIHRHNAQSAGKSQQRANGQINAAADDDESHADSNDPAVGNLPADIQQILGTAESLAGHCAGAKQYQQSQPGTMMPNQTRPTLPEKRFSTHNQKPLKKRQHGKKR